MQLLVVSVALCKVYSRVVNITVLVSLPVVSAILFSALLGMQTWSCNEISVLPSVCPSIRLSNACIVTKRKKSQSRFLYHAIDNLV